jgi:hypothetical protein
MTVVAAEEGGTLPLPTSQARADERALTDEQLGVLAQLARRAEEHFGGSPQDIEWAFVGDRCALLQSRPVTNLPPPPLENVRWDPPVPGSVWIRRQVAENLPEPLSPLFDELYLRQGLERSLEALLVFFKMPWLHLEDIAYPPFFTTINGYAYQRANFKVGLKTLVLALRGAFDGWRVMWSDAVPFWRDQALPSYLATVQRWRAQGPAELSNQQLVDGIRELAWADATYWYACAVVVANAKWTDALLDRFLSVAAPRRRLTSGLF